MKKILLLGLCMVLAAPPPLFADGLPDLGESAEVELSPFAERSIGEAVMNEIRLHEPTYLDDPEVTAYLNEIGRRLASRSGEARQDFEFFALRDPVVNAFAMPGGFIGVHSGLILLTQSESELASVLAHEISHVTQHHLARQLRPQMQSQTLALLAFAAAVIASRNRPDLAQGAIMAGQGIAIQNQLSYSRDFEREADRLGLNLLERAGFDIRAMESFFDRMEKNNRLYEANAQSYLRTHPLSIERMSDLGNRIQQRPYVQVVDSLDFLLVRAKLMADSGSVQDAQATFRARIGQRKFAAEAAANYGMALALMRGNDFSGAEESLRAARRDDTTSPLFETLAAELRLKQKDTAGALAILAAAKARYPGNRAITYLLLDTQIREARFDEALRLATNELRIDGSDPRLHQFQARCHAGLGHILQQHRAQAEAYARYGQTVAAIEQLTLAQKAPDGDFYEHSQVDARLRELRALESAKPRPEQGGERGNWKEDHDHEF